MKKLLPLTLLLLSFNSFGQQKTDGPEDIYQPFLDTNKMWIEYFNNTVDFQHEQDIWGKNVIQLRKFNDTIFEVISTTIELTEWDNFESNPSFPYATSYEIQDEFRIGFLQEDTIERKVYGYSIYFLNGFGERRLIYDFKPDLDTVDMYFNFSLDKSKVDSVRQLNFHDMTNYQRIYLPETQVDGNCYANIEFPLDFEPPGILFYDTRMGGTMNLIKPFQQPAIKLSQPYACRICYFENDQALWGNQTECQILLEHFQTGFLNVSEIDIKDFSIYPNPATSQIIISGLENENQEIFIYDLNGKKVLNAVVTNNQSLDVSELSRGIYTIRFKESLLTKKLIIQ